jgi:hypothetical protein
MPGTNFIIVMQTEHASTINSLAEEGKIQPVGFVLPGGQQYMANSMWAATEWLAKNGHRCEDYKNVEFIRTHVKFYYL